MSRVFQHWPWRPMIVALLALFVAGPTPSLAAWKQPVAGTLNFDATKPAFSPSIVPGFNGGPFVAWTEPVGMADQVRVKRLGSGGWTETGGSLNTDATKGADNPALGSVNGVPYAAWVQFNGTGDDVRVAAFSGGVWSAVGGSLSFDASKFAEHPRIASVGPNIVSQHPEVVWTEKSAAGNYKIRVKQFNMGTWTEVVGSPNFDPSKDAFAPSIASFKGVPYIAWKESSGSAYQVRVARLSSGAWAAVGGVVSGSGDANNPDIANIGGVPYVTWDELDASRSSVQAARFSGSSWSTVGGSLNVDSGTNARNPSIANVGGVPYVAWDESDGLHSLIRVKRLLNDSWSSVDGTLNVDPAKAATDPSIANVGGVPYIAFTEVSGTAFQLRVKRLEPDFLSQRAVPTKTGATLTTRARTYGIPYPIGFDYGTALEHQTTTDTAPSGADTVTVTRTVTGLHPGTHYKFQPFAIAGIPLPLALGPLGAFSPDATPPSLTSVRVKPTKFAINPKGVAEAPVPVAAKHTKRGTTFRYSLSEPGRVVFTIERKVSGRRVGGNCVKATKSNKGKPKCTRLTLVGGFAKQSAAGKNAKRFSGKIGKKQLKPGHYRASLVATDLAGNPSLAKHLRFTVVKP